MTHVLVAPKFYNGPIPLNEVQPCLPSKYFGKLFDIYQLNIVRLHLWKLGIYSSWGKLRSHCPVFLGVRLAFPSKNFGKFQKFLISFVAGTISGKWEAYRTHGPIPPNLRELTEWISVLLQILPCLEGQTCWEKWGEITRQEILLLFTTCFSIILSI